MNGIYIFNILVKKIVDKLFFGDEIRFYFFFNILKYFIIVFFINVML